MQQMWKGKLEKEEALPSEQKKARMQRSFA